MHDLKTALTGVSGILVTPFDQSEALSAELQGPIVERAIGAGVHILVANGNTGEFYSLTVDEAEAMVRSAASHVDGRVPLLAGVGRGVADAVRLTRASVAAGADAIMVHQPPDPFVAPRGVVEYVERIRDAAGDVPLVLYLRNDTIGIQAIKALCGIENVVGVKWATPNPLKLAEAIRETDEDIVWVGGLAEAWAPSFYAVGARGFTSGLINVWPERSVAIHAALEAGDYPQARRLIDEMRAFEDIRAEELNGTNVTAVKAALALLGHDCGPTRPPSAWPLDANQHRRLSDFVTANALEAFDRQKVRAAE